MYASYGLLVKLILTDCDLVEHDKNFHPALTYDFQDSEGPYRARDVEQ